MESFETITNIILILYALASFGGLAGMLLRNDMFKKISSYIVLLGFSIQTVSLAMGSHSVLPGGLSWGAYLQLMAWFLVLCGLTGWFIFKEYSSAIFSAPLALLIFSISQLFLDYQVMLPKELTAYFYALHIGTLFLSLALISLGFGAGLLFIQMERKIKSKTKLKDFQKDFPALNILDKINAITTFIGFPLYTIGLVSGFIWAKPAFGLTISGDPKEIVSIAIWFAYSLLFHNRLTQNWRGRKPAVLSVWLFCLSVFSLLIVNSFMDTHHAFIKD